MQKKTKGFIKINIQIFIYFVTFNHLKNKTEKSKTENQQIHKNLSLCYNKTSKNKKKHFPKEQNKHALYVFTATRFLFSE